MYLDIYIHICERIAHCSQHNSLECVLQEPEIRIGIRASTLDSSMVGGLTNSSHSMTAYFSSILILDRVVFLSLFILRLNVQRSLNIKSQPNVQKRPDRIANCQAEEALN